MNSKLKPYNHRWILLAFLMAWACVIFSFSQQGSGISSEQSGLITQFFSKFPALNNLNHIIQLEIIVRKCAHMFEYAVFSSLVMCYLSYFNFKNGTKVLISIASAAVYGVTDELHQMLIPGRASRLFDVGFDTLGGSIGTLITLFVIVKIVKHKAKKKANKC